MFDRLFWFFNKKPAFKSSAYLTTVLYYFVYGIIFFIGGVLLFAPQTTPKIMGVILLVLSSSMLIYMFYWDNKDGFVDAMNQAYLAKRERIGKKLGKMWVVYNGY